MLTFFIIMEQVTAIDPDKEAFEVGFPLMKKAGVDHKISFINSDASSALNDMLNNVSVEAM